MSETNWVKLNVEPTAKTTANKRPERLLILVSGGRVTNGNAVVDAAKLAWSTRGQAAKVEIDLGEMSEPPNAKAQIQTLSEVHQ